MNWILFFSLIFGALIVLITSAPTEKSKDEKRDIKSSEMDDIFADDLKSKRSQEVIMFGNQQNKPAGMVDDALVGFADKKSVKSQEDEEDENDDSDEPIPNNGTDKKDSKVPVVAEMGTDDQEMDEEPSVESDDISVTDNNEQEVEPYLPARNFQNSYQYDELNDGTATQRMEDKNINNINDIAEDWLEYGSNQRKRRNIKRNGRNFQKRSLLTPLDKLMNLRHGARWKRDLKFREDDVVGLLGLLAAAEIAKERQELERKHNLEEMEAAYKESMGHPDFSRFEEPRNDDFIAGNFGYYPTRYEDSEETDQNPDFIMLEPEISLKRRSKPFFPPVDYRSLGIIGSKKRSMELPHRQGLWGPFEHRKRPLFKEPDFVELAEMLQNEEDANANSNEEDEEDGNGREDEMDEDKLYTLGELLNGNDVEDERYPVFRRFI